MNAATASLEPPSASMPAATIFLVEDEALIAMELQDHLENFGYRVCGHAARGEIALEKIRELRPDLILMDIHLAGRMSGIDTAAQLGGQERSAVIFLSAYSDPALLNQALRTGPFGYLVKPVNPRGLHAAIEVALHRRRLELELRVSHAACEERVADLRQAAQQAAKLPDTLTVCPHCRSVQPGGFGWSSFEHFLVSHAGTEIAYAACPRCAPGRPAPEATRRPLA